MNQYVRILFSIMLPVFFLFDGILAQRSLLAWCGLAIILLLYLLIVWTDQSWWTRTKYALAVGLAITLTLIIHRFNGGNGYDSSLLVPLVLLLAKEQRNHRRFTTVLAIVTMGVIISIAPTYALALWWIVSVIPVYLSIRFINISKEANRLSQLHLQELAEAHQELERTHAALQEASVHSIRYAALAERTRLAQDLHDGIGHQLTSLIVQLQALEIMLPGDPRAAADVVPAMLAVTRNAMAEVRHAVKAWQEDEGGLGLVALQGLVAQCAAHTHLNFTFQPDDGLSDWPLEVSVVLYRVLQEALTNIMRHADATTVTVQVQERDQQVILTVADNGCYTASTELSCGYGVKGIMKRSQALGGCCTLSQNQTHGLKLQVILPLSPLTADDGALKRTPPGGHVEPHLSLAFSGGRELHE
ncbi:MAG: sensor histidine kinase [Ktedonobacterales bacterium]